MCRDQCGTLVASLKNRSCIFVLAPDSMTPRCVIVSVCVCDFFEGTSPPALGLAAVRRFVRGVCTYLRHQASVWTFISAPEFAWPLSSTMLWLCFIAKKHFKWFWRRIALGHTFSEPYLIIFRRRQKMELWLFLSKTDDDMYLHKCQRKKQHSHHHYD